MDLARRDAPIRILQIISVGYGAARPELCGSSAAATGITEALSRAGADVSLFAVDPNASVDYVRTGPHGAHEHYFRPSVRSRFNISQTLARECRRQIPQFSIVHIHGLWRFPSAIGASLCRRLGIPYVLSPHGMLNEWAFGFKAHWKLPAWYAIERRTVGGAARLHFCSDAESAEAGARALGVPSSVVPLPVDVDQFASLPDRGGFRQQHRIPPDAPLVGFVGRVHPIKALDVLLRALPKAATVFPSITVALAGPDENGHSQELQALASELGIADRIRWVGPVYGADKLVMFADLDLFALPSFSENLGLAALEAMAAGCPVILGAGVNIAAEIEQFGAGWRVQSDPEALAAGLIAALGDDADRRARAAAGRRFVATRYGADAMAQRFLDLYSTASSR